MKNTNGSIKLRFAVQSIISGDVVSRHRHLATAEKIARRKNKQFGERYNGRHGFTVLWWNANEDRWEDYVKWNS